MNTLLELIANNLILTLIIAAILITSLWRFRFIAISTAVLFVILSSYVSQFAKVEQRAVQTDSAYAGCLQRQLCAMSSPRCNDCANVPADEREDCLLLLVNREGIDESNQILSACQDFQQSSYIRETLENIWGAITPF